MGSRMAIVAAGPRPGSTPMSMPMTTPTMMGVKSMAGLPSDQSREGDGQGEHEQRVERRDGDDADDCRHAPRLAAEEAEPDHHEHERGHLEPDDGQEGREPDQGEDPEAGEGAGPGELLRVLGAPAEGDLRQGEGRHRD